MSSRQPCGPLQTGLLCPDHWARMGLSSRSVSKLLWLGHASGAEASPREWGAQKKCGKAEIKRKYELESSNWKRHALQGRGRKADGLVPQRQLVFDIYESAGAC